MSIRKDIFCFILMALGSCALAQSPIDLLPGGPDGEGKNDPDYQLQSLQTQGQWGYVLDEPTRRRVFWRQPHSWSDERVDIFLQMVVEAAEMAGGKRDVLLKVFDLPAFGNEGKKIQQLIRQKQEADATLTKRGLAKADELFMAAQKAGKKETLEYFQGEVFNNLEKYGIRTFPEQTQLNHRGIEVKTLALYLNNVLKGPEKDWLYELLGAHYFQSPPFEFPKTYWKRLDQLEGPARSHRINMNKAVEDASLNRVLGWKKMAEWLTENAPVTPVMPSPQTHIK